LHNHHKRPKLIFKHEKAAETHQAARVEIQSALANIPRKLEEIKTFEEILMPSPNLYQSANNVFVAIFAVLERIIHKLSKTTLGKGA
jgi:hypothetical protein